MRNACKPLQAETGCHHKDSSLLLPQLQMASPSGLLLIRKPLLQFRGQKYSTPCFCARKVHKFTQALPFVQTYLWPLHSRNWLIVTRFLFWFPFGQQILNHQKVVLLPAPVVLGLKSNNRSAKVVWIRNVQRTMSTSSELHSAHSQCCTYTCWILRKYFTARGVFNCWVKCLW